MPKHESLDDNNDAWKVVIDGMLATLVAIPAAQRAAAAREFVVQPEAVDLFGNFGVLQSYLREQGAIIQLVARQFDPANPEHQGMACLDIATGTPRAYYLSVEATYTGQESTPVALQEIGMSDEVNEHLLAHETGVLVGQGPR